MTRPADHERLNAKRLPHAWGSHAPVFEDKVRYVELAAAQESIIESIALSPLAMVLSNPNRPDNPLEVVNSAFAR